MLLHQGGYGDRRGISHNPPRIAKVKIGFTQERAIVVYDTQSGRYGSTSVNQTDHVRMNGTNKC